MNDCTRVNLAMSSSVGLDKMKRYEKFAEEVAELIRTGVLAPGEKVPSVRHASRTYGVSLSTVFQAYYLLESRGLIQARARSGYFVREHAQKPLHEPTTTGRAVDVSDVGVSELVFSVLKSLKDADTVAFGSAFPHPDLYPLARLARSLAHSAREMSGQAIMADMTEGNPDLRRQIALRYMVSGVMLPRQWFSPVWPTKPAKNASRKKPPSHRDPVHPTAPRSEIA